jgi:superfamily I DNA/RNA helicase
MPKERRLAYVALSRAKTNLYVSHAARDANGQPTTASRFLRELPAEMIASEMAYDEPRA